MSKKYKGKPSIKKSNKKTKSDIQSFKKDVETDNHKISVEDLLERLGTDQQLGLSHSAAKLRLELDGPNTLTPPPRTPEWVNFLKNMFGGFAMLLWAGALLCFTAYLIEKFTKSNITNDNLYLGLALLAVVIITGLFSYFQVK